MHMCTPICNLHVGYNTKSALMGLHLRCVLCVCVHACVRACMQCLKYQTLYQPIVANVFQSVLILVRKVVTILIANIYASYAEQNV